MCGAERAILSSNEAGNQAGPSQCSDWAHTIGADQDAGNASLRELPSSIGRDGDADPDRGRASETELKSAGAKGRP